MRTDQQLDNDLKAEGMWDSLRYLDSQRKLATASFSGGERDHLFLNLSTREFRDVAGVSGLDAPGDGRVFVHWDYDRDGWQDFAVASTNSPMLNLYHNEIGRDKPTPNLIALRFIGGNTTPNPSSEWSNRDGYGAKVIAEVGGRTLLREHRCGEGLAAQNSSTMLIGLDEETNVASLTVKWPSGKSSILTKISAGTLVSVYENPVEWHPNGGHRTQPYLAEQTDGAILLGKSANVVDQGLLTASLPIDTDADVPVLRAYTSMASWCTSCKRWLPQLQELDAELSRDQLQLFGVPVDLNDSPEVLHNYIDQCKPSYKLLAALPNENRNRFRDFAQQQLKTDALPYTVVVDREGKVLLSVSGVPTVSEIRRLLAEQ